MTGRGTAAMASIAKSFAKIILIQNIVQFIVAGSHE